MGINLDELTFRQIKELRAVFEGVSAKTPKTSVSPQFFTIGESYFIRSVTYHYTGRVAAVTDQGIVLEEAAWIADSGRFTPALEKGSFYEVEPYPSDVQVHINMGAIVDASQWKLPLPLEQK